MNFKSRKDYQEHVEYCTDEAYGMITNIESDYLFFMKIVGKPWTVKRKAGALRYNYSDMHNGYHNVGRMARWTDVVKREMGDES